MRLPRFRFTIRRLMLWVVIAAIILVFERFVLMQWQDFVHRHPGDVTWEDCVAHWFWSNFPVVLLIAFFTPAAITIHKAGHK